MPPAAQVLHPTFAIPASLAQGTYFIGVIADPEGRLTDSNRANNIGVSPSGVVIATNGRLPDLTPLSVVTPPTANSGSSVVVLENISNIGQVAAPQGFVSRWFVSTDNIITTADTPVGSAACTADDDAAAASSPAPPEVIPASEPAAPVAAAPAVLAPAQAEGAAVLPPPPHPARVRPISLTETAARTRFITVILR